MPGRSGKATASQQGRGRGPDTEGRAWKAILEWPEGQPEARPELYIYPVRAKADLYIHTVSGNPAERRLQRARGKADPTVITGTRRTATALGPSWNITIQ